MAENSSTTHTVPPPLAKAGSSNSKRPAYENFPVPSGSSPTQTRSPKHGDSKSNRPAYENFSCRSGSANSSPRTKKSFGSPKQRRGSATEWYVDLPKGGSGEIRDSEPVAKDKNGSLASPTSPSGSDDTPVILRTRLSDSILALKQNPVVENSASPPPDLLDAKLRLLAEDIVDDEGCEKCKELASVVALWELGVSGLTRNYSKILSLLNKAREASTKLEFQLKQKVEVKSSLQLPSRNMSVSGRNAKTYNVRQSMYETGNSTPASNMVDQMYPQELESASSFSLPYLKSFTDLNTHLGQAIDLCQQQAAANFKNNQRTPSRRARLVRQPSVPTSLGESDTNADFRPTLQSIAEASLSGSFKKKAPLERTPSAPDSMIRRKPGSGVQMDKSEPTIKKQNSLSKLEMKENEDFVEVAAPVSSVKLSDDCTQTTPTHDNYQSSTGAEPSTSVDTSQQKQFHSHMLQLSSTVEHEVERSSEQSGESDDKEALSSTESESQQGFRESVVSVSSTFSDNDVKQVMSKIADLEEERLKLLGTIDNLQRDNGQVRLSFTEILGDLENKDLQLTVAMQDLTIATGEIMKAAEMRRRLQKMENDRAALLDRLSNLEDESAAVKVSLIQLLQEKSATNKTLALENSRLNQRMKQFAAMTLRRGSKAGTSNGFGATGDGDNTSIISAATEDATLQEAYMGTDDVAAFVHKQGFLVKQGGKVKSWKRRLFVLSTEGLAYFKTEQPLQTIPMNKIEKVQICHGNRSQYPYLFEVHTPGRVFLLSAPSEDEMQSWVGMLQTLKQYNRAKTLNREATLRAQATLDAAHEMVPPPGGASANDGDWVGDMTGGEMDDDDDEEDHLPLHQNHFGFGSEDDDDIMVLSPGATPMSVPTLNSPLEESPSHKLDHDLFQSKNTTHPGSV